MKRLFIFSNLQNTFPSSKRKGKEARAVPYDWCRSSVTVTRTPRRPLQTLFQKKSRDKRANTGEGEAHSPGNRPFPSPGPTIQSLGGWGDTAY